MRILKAVTGFLLAIPIGLLGIPYLVYALAKKCWDADCWIWKD